jgi:preprotein translocase subunit YajC
VKRRVLFIPLALILIALLMAAAPAQADDRQCTGTIGAVDVDGNVVVPSGATCTLGGTRVDDNVLVRPGAVLEAFGVSVGGNIQAENHLRVIVGVRTVNGTVVLPRIGGDIQLFDGDRGTVWQAVIGGNLQVNQNSGFQEAVRNVIDGDLQAFSNGGGFRIYGNRIDGNLQCKSNDPPPVGGENVVEGNKEDQCSQLEPSPSEDGSPRPPDGGPGPGAEPLPLDLGAKKQELRKKLKLFATVTADSTLVATGKAIKETTKELAANEKTKVKAKLKRKQRKKLANKLDKKGKAKVQVKATATDQSGATATDTVKVKLKD